MTDTTHTPQKLRWHRLLPMAIIVVAAVLGAATLGEVLSYETLRDNREALIAYRDAHYVGTVFVFMTVYIAIVAFSLPGALVASLTGGFLFGTLAGTFINVSAATIGACGIFLAARWGFGDRLAARMQASDGKVKRIKEGIDKNQWSMLFLIRLVPLVPFFVANLIPALVGVPMRRFVISTFFGIIPGGVVYTSVGAGLGEVFERGETPDLGIIFEPYILLPLLGLSLLAALPMILKAVRGTREL